MAEFIQQNHQPSHALCRRFEQQIVASSELQAIDLDQVKIDQLQLQYLLAGAEQTAHNLNQYYDQLMYGYQGLCTGHKNRTKLS